MFLLRKYMQKILPSCIKCSIIFGQFFLRFYCITTNNVSLGTNVVEHALHGSKLNVRVELKELKCWLTKAPHTKTNRLILLTVYNSPQYQPWSSHLEGKLRIEDSSEINTKLLYSKTKHKCTFLKLMPQQNLSFTGLKFGNKASRPGGKTTGI